MQHNACGMTNLLIHQKVLDIGSLVSTQLDDFSHFQILLDGAITTEILLKGFANALHVQVVGESCHCGNTFSSISLLDTNVNLFFGGGAALVSGIIESVW